MVFIILLVLGLLRVGLGFTWVMFQIFVFWARVVLTFLGVGLGFIEVGLALIYIVLLGV